MITPADAANAVNYLLAAGATPTVDHQAEVWADYLNHEVVGGPRASELGAACRRAIRDWVREARAYRIDVERFAQAVRRERADRVRAEEDARGALLPTGLAGEPAVEAAWRRAALEAVGAGADREAAEAHAWRAIGRTPPPPAITSTALSGRERARAVVEALARSSHPGGGGRPGSAPNRARKAPRAA